MKQSKCSGGVVGDSNDGDADRIERKLIGIGNEIFSTEP